MKKKWYFGILMTALAVLVVIQQQTVVPNQEIVLEFVNIEITSKEAQNAIANVKKQLQSIGVKNTIVSKELENGTLKIAYYSDEDVEFIKRTLSEAQNIALDHVFYDQTEEDSQFPLPKNSKDYNLDVYKIQESTDIDSDYNGLYVLELKHEQDADSSTNLYSLITKTDDNLDRLVKVAQKLNSTIVIAIDTISHTIPEVRAGPIS